MILPYPSTVLCSPTAMASIVLARFTAVLQAPEATGAAVVESEPCAAAPVLGVCCLTGEALVAPAAAPAGRSSDQATAPTKTPPASVSRAEPAMLDYPTAGGVLPSPAAVAARASYVPHRTDTRGTERTTTVTLAPPMSWSCTLVVLSRPACTHPANF
jgi:hypothetical protein